eukprot:9504009-Pyramimonas_sp.AAC.1
MADDDDEQVVVTPPPPAWLCCVHPISVRTRSWAAELQQGLGSRREEWGGTGASQSGDEHTPHAAASNNDLLDSTGVVVSSVVPVAKSHHHRHHDDSSSKVGSKEGGTGSQPIGASGDGGGSSNIALQGVTVATDVDRRHHNRGRRRSWGDRVQAMLRPINAGTASGGGSSSRAATTDDDVHRPSVIGRDETRKNEQLPPLSRTLSGLVSPRHTLAVYEAQTTDRLMSTRSNARRKHSRRGMRSSPVNDPAAATS